MTSHSTWKILAAVLAGGVATEANANRYVITDLGQDKTPVAVNHVNVVAANQHIPHLRGEIWRVRAWHNLPAHSQVASINRAGEAVGINSLDMPALWPHNGGEVEIVIQVPAGGHGGGARGINNSEVVVGWYQNSEQILQCYSWTAEQGAVDFGVGQDILTCDAFGVNSLGQITGQASIAGGYLDAFLWSDGKFLNLGQFDDANSSVGLSLNDGGDVVGADYTDNGSRAFLWNGTLNELDVHHTFVVSVATSINNSGDVVGYVQESNSAEPVAVRFAHSEILRLDREVTELGDWKLLQATAINDKGVIVGAGLLGGAAHAFMLSPAK